MAVTAGLVEKEMEIITGQGGDPDSGLELVRLLKEKGLKFRYGSVPMDTSLDEIGNWLRMEREYVASSGREGADISPEIFHVPFIWAVVDVSG